jgi:hypothetical protein
MNELICVSYFAAKGNAVGVGSIIYQNLSLKLKSNNLHCD